MGTVTISGTEAVVFGTLDGANTYFNLSIRSDAWTAASGTLRQKALVSATRWLQRLGLTDAEGNEIVPSADDTDVPVAVQEGNYELAQVLIEDVSASDNATTGSNIKSVKAGTTEVQFFRQTQGTVLPTVAMQLLSEYLDAGKSSIAGSSVGPMAGGSDEESVFGDRDSWGRTTGFP